MELLNSNIILAIGIVSLWVIPWKGYALWVASQRRDKKWFLVLLVVNTFALLEIVYLFYIVKKTPKDIVNLFKTKL